MARFRTSARSVDMLGRQQIAGIPTAVSEIFKNAYDAYAKRVRGDYFPDRRVLVIRDDGVGMSLEDFEARWLTVGTDSKAKDSALPKVPRPEGVEARRQMGEKGIGRLAIASLAPQLLVVSRPYGSFGTADDHVVVALVQWSLFEAPGLTLEDVAVPIRVYPALESLTAEAVSSMRDEFLAALDGLGGRLDSAHASRIRHELEGLDLEVEKYLRLNGPRVGAEPGTAFVLSAVYEDLDSAMQVNDAKANDFSVSDFQRFLLGFSNTITEKPGTELFATEFVRHDPSGLTDLIDPASYFWDADDFDDADHTVEGEFDEFGTFHGSLSIYGREPLEVVERWAGSKGDPTVCGPFRIKFGYVQGQASDSRLPPETFAVMTGRLEKIGGLYVYRDGIRVLPYGNSDYDYLRVEHRRSLNAGTYFFSYRRMFGAIEIDSERNRLLQEKAGREGFRENRAYHDFREILKNFLVQLAANYFSAKAESAEEWRAERERLHTTASQRGKQERAERLARERFMKVVREALEFVESGRLGVALDAVVVRVSQETLESAGATGIDLDRSELAARSALEQLRERLSITRPVDLPLSRDEERDLRSLEKLAEFANDLFSKATNSIGAALRDARGRAGERENHERERRERIARLESLYDDGSERILELGAAVEARATSLGGSLTGAARASVAAFGDQARSLLEEAELAGFADEVQLSDEIRQVTAAHAAALEQLLAQAQALLDGGDLQRENLLLKEQVLDLREQLDGNLELLQLGQVVQIVSHEFEASIGSVRRGLRALQPWAKSTPRLYPIVRDVRASFAHLDGYLRLFTPLQRRLYRESVTITGQEIEAFLRGVFGERLERHGVELLASEDFRAWGVSGFPSTFYPVFVNLVDNAIHWVSEQLLGDRRILLEADQLGVTIRDTGPGVRPRDSELIFERGFSRRRGGRGLGLSLAKEILARDGWRLELVPRQVGAEFRLAAELGEDHEH